MFYLQHKQRTTIHNLCLAVCLKSGFHNVLAGRTALHVVFRYIDTNAHKQSHPSQKTSTRKNTSRTCWIFPSGCEACAPICCDLSKPRTQTTEEVFCVPGKKSKDEEQHYLSECNQKQTVLLFIFFYTMSLSQRKVSQLSKEDKLPNTRKLHRAGNSTLLYYGIDSFSATLLVYVISSRPHFPSRPHSRSGSNRISRPHFRPGPNRTSRPHCR